MPFGLALSAAVVSGVATGVVTPVAPAEALAAALVVLSIALVAEGRALGAPLGLIVIFAGAMAYGALARERALTPPLATWFDTVAGADDRASDVVVIAGTLSSDASPAEGGVRLRIDVDWVRDARGEHRAPGSVQVHVAGTLAVSHMTSWTAGRRIRAAATLRRPALVLNPGSPSPRWLALRRPFDLTAGVKSAALVEVERAVWWRELAARLRRHVRDAAATYLAPASPQAAAIATAILIGDRAGLGDVVQRRLQAAGTYHVIAISGGNVALLTALCFALLRVLVRSPRIGSLLTLLVVLAYGALVGGDPSVRRAVTAACLYLGIGLVGLVPRALNVLSTVAVILVLADPLAVIDVGAWLSFGATLGIIVGAGRFSNWALAGRMPPHLPHGRLGAGGARAPSLSKRGRPRQARGLRAGPPAVLRAVVTLLGASVAAELALMPIAAAVFARVSVAGLALNFIAIPAMACVQITGLLTVVLAGWWPAGASVSATAARVAADVLVGSAGLVDVAPWLSWRVPPVPPLWTVLYYCGCTICLLPRVLPAAGRVSAAVAATSLVVIVSSPQIQSAGPGLGRLRVTMLDVGQGDAILVQFPSGHAMLVDTGGAAGSYDIGGRVVTPAAWSLGVRRLDWLVITHGDRDHVGGALGVAVDLAPREIWEGVPVLRNPDLAVLQADARAHRRVRRLVQAGHAFDLGGVTVDVRHPPMPEWERQKVRNDDSIVLRLRYGDVEFLLTGDAGAEFEQRIDPEAGLAPLRVLKVGHHGSRTSTSHAFVTSYRPQVALISAGRGNLFGHPAPEVLARLVRIGAEVFRTDVDGAVILETDGRAVGVRPARGTPWTLGVLRTSS